MKIAVCLFLCLVARSPSMASNLELIANFDSFAEGALGTAFVDKGILFSELENDSLGIFSVDSRGGASVYINMSLPNTLSTFGYSEGEGAGLSRVRSFKITPPSTAMAASVDVYLSTLPEVRDRRFVVDALWNDQVVGTTSVLAGTGTNISFEVEYHPLSIHAEPFDSLKRYATDALGNPSYTFATYDNVRITLVPEPLTAGLSLAAIFVMLLSARYSPSSSGTDCACQ